MSNDILETMTDQQRYCKEANKNVRKKVGNTMKKIKKDTDTDDNSPKEDSVVEFR